MSKYSLIRYIIPIIIFLSITNISYSQEKLAFHAGMNYSKFHYTEGGHFSASMDFLTNIDVGLSYKSARRKNINMGITINYRQKSLDIDASWGGLGGGTELDMTARLGYLNFNLYPEFGIGDRIRFYIQPGIFIGGLIRSKEEGIMTDYFLQSEPEFKFRYVRDTTLIDGKSGLIGGPDLGIRMNTGFEFYVSENIRLVMEVGISRGINNTGKGSFGSYAGIFNSANYSFTIGLLYNLKIDALFDLEN